MAGPEPADFLVEHRAELVAAARLGPVVDLACGGGRNALAAARWGPRVIGVDRNDLALRALARAASDERLPIELVRTDLEAPASMPLRAGAFGAVLVFRYLHRARAEEIAGLLCPGGLLLYETFTHHQRNLPQGPNNPDFLLEDQELPRLFPGLRVLTHRETIEDGVALASLAARHPPREGRAGEAAPAGRRG